jgi:hypothetical protein
MPLPKISSEALAASKQHGGGKKRALARWFKELEVGDLDPDTIDVYENIHCDPPWQSGECSGLVVIFRAMTDAEGEKYQENGHAPLFYVAFVVPPEEEPAALARLEAEIRDQEKREAEEETKEEETKKAGEEG